MVTIILLKDFNNYYNRRVKRYTTVNEYISAVASGDYYSLETTNFNPRDGVTTHHVFNFPAGEDTPSFADGGAAPDYCLILGANNEILSRWFVVEAEFSRGGQYNISLFRDTVADNYDAIIGAPCFIEKATVNENDPAIFNSESMGFNQIKTGEYPLKDKSNSAWLVFYKAKDIQDESFEITLGGDGSAINIGMPIEDFGLYEYSNLATTPRELRSNPSYPRQFIECKEINAGIDKRHFFKYNSSNSHYSERVGSVSLRESWKAFLSEFAANTSESDWLTACYNKADIEVNIDNYLYYNGLKIKTSDNRYFTCSVTPKQQSTNTYFNHITPADPTLWQMFNDGLTAHHSGSPDNNSFGIVVDYIPYEVILTEELGGTTADFNASLLTKTKDATYDMMCLPYTEDFAVITDDGTYHITADTAMQTMTQLATAYSDNCYDIQLLPYCPTSEFINALGALDLRTHTEMYQYVLVHGTSTKLFPIMACPKAKFSGQIKYKLPGKNESIKIQNECDVYRICSPNYNGQFEFSPAKNRSAREGTNFEFDCFYQPYQPYIHVAPIFNASGLYGKDFNDARGLICGGDFSLPIMKNKWIDYQVQNKNFQNIFDRQIQNMEVNNSIARIQARWQAAVGTVTGASTGAAAGFSVGGGYGAAAGAVVGGATSLAGGIADLNILKRQQAEAIDYSKDLFGYQLGNIQALPNTITKVSPFNPNNKVFPFLEFYTCTDVERQALTDKITYNGMTVMRIGKIEDFLQDDETYIKGKLIRIEGIADEFHMAVTIADEINKGVFIR